MGSALVSGTDRLAKPRELPTNLVERVPRSVPNGAPFDLFVSYSRRDNQRGRISDLRALLKERYRDLTRGDELRIFFDEEEIKGMDDWRHRILYGIRSTRLLLVCLSPNYLESEYCVWELNEYLNQEAALALVGEGIAPVYLVDIPGWSAKSYAHRAAEWIDNLRRRQHIDLRLWFNEKTAAVNVSLDELNNQIRVRLNRVRLAVDAKGNVE